MSGCPFAQQNGNGSAGSHDDTPHYAPYLHLDTLLQLQDGPSSLKPAGRGCMHDEELTFIVVHQAIELWFKLATSDLTDACVTLQRLHDALTAATATATAAATATATAAHASATTRRCAVAPLHARVMRRLERVVLTLQQATGALDVLVRMHASEFLEFRDYLTPASGFQSVAWRALEQLLGVCDATRACVHGASVQSYLRADEVAHLRRAAAAQPSLNELLLSLLAEGVVVPSSFVPAYLAAAARVYGAEAGNGNSKSSNKDDNNKDASDDDDDSAPHKTARTAQARARVAALRAMLEAPAEHARVHAPTPEARRRFDKAAIAALFVLCYREDSGGAGVAAAESLAPLATLLDAVLSLEEATLLFRARHAMMAERMIGSRRGGTVGTISGVGYLRETQQYRVFAVLWLVRCMLLPPSTLPPLTTLFATSTTTTASATVA